MPEVSVRVIELKLPCSHKICVLAVGLRKDWSRVSDQEFISIQP